MHLQILLNPSPLLFFNSHYLPALIWTESMSTFLLIYWDKWNTMHFFCHLHVLKIQDWSIIIITFLFFPGIIEYIFNHFKSIILIKVGHNVQLGKQNLTQTLMKNVCFVSKLWCCDISVTLPRSITLEKIYYCFELVNFTYSWGKIHHWEKYYSLF